MEQVLVTGEFDINGELTTSFILSEDFDFMGPLMSLAETNKSFWLFTNGFSYRLHRSKTFNKLVEVSNIKEFTIEIIDDDY